MSVIFLFEGSMLADLDNLAKPVLDTIFRADHALHEDITGALFDVDDQHVHRLSLEKRIVNDAASQGVEIEISWEDQAIPPN